MSERDFKNTPTDVLEKILGQGTIERDPAMYELQRRLAKPHWTLLPTYFLACCGLCHHRACCSFPSLESRYSSDPFFDGTSASGAKVTNFRTSKTAGTGKIAGRTFWGEAMNPWTILGLPLVESPNHRLETDLRTRSQRSRPWLLSLSG